jgi:hypothetical protein
MRLWKPHDPGRSCLHLTIQHHVTNRIVQVLTEIPAGAESVWHTHPAEEVGYILAGTVEMRSQGQPTLTLHAPCTTAARSSSCPVPPHNALDIGPETGRMLCTYIVEVGQPTRLQWRRLAVVAALRRGADGIDHSIRITESLLDHLVCWVQATWVSRRESSLGPAAPGMEGGAMPDLRAIRQPRLGWIVTADRVIPPAAQLAMPGTPRPTSSRSTPPTCR